MSKKQKKVKNRNSYEVNKAIRHDWGEVKPYTRIEEDRRFKKDKYRKGWDEE